LVRRGRGRRREWGGNPATAGCRAVSAGRVCGGMSSSAVRAREGGGGAALRDGAEVATFGAGGIDASVGRLGVRKGAEGADRAIRFASMSNMSEGPAPAALSIRRVIPQAFNPAVAREESQGRAQPVDLIRGESNNN